MKKLNPLLEKINNGDYLPCWVCLEMKGRIILTDRYCNICEEAFCEDHGSFRGGRIPYCIMDNTKLIKRAKENKVK